MKIKSGILAAAQYCQGKNEVRHYLNGIHINRKYVQATNGHIAIQMEHGAKIRVPMIVHIRGKVPVKAQTTKLEFGRDGGTDGLAKHYDVLDQLISVQVIDLIQGRFPDFTKGCLFGDMSMYSRENKMPAINMEYMALPSKFFPKDKFCATRALPSGDKSPVLFEFGAFVNELYGNPKFLIMPMSWDEMESETKP